MTTRVRGFWENIVKRGDHEPQARPPAADSYRPAAPALEIAPNDPTIGESTPQARVRINVRRVNDKASIVDVWGGLTIFAENMLMDAYPHASSGGAGAIILNFSELEHMNSSGIGLLITLLIRANRQKERILSFGMSEHYRRIFELAGLHEAIGIYGSEAEALDAANVCSEISHEGGEATHDEPDEVGALHQRPELSLLARQAPPQAQGILLRGGQLFRRRR
jgi:anti-sigma B factor antagonist